jgi:hypothetical protein
VTRVFEPARNESNIIIDGVLEGFFPLTSDSILGLNWISLSGIISVSGIISSAILDFTDDKESLLTLLLIVGWNIRLETFFFFDFNRLSKKKTDIFLIFENFDFLPLESSSSSLIKSPSVGTLLWYCIKTIYQWTVWLIGTIR